MKDNHPDKTADQQNTVKPVLKATCINQLPSLRGHIFGSLLTRPAEPGYTLPLQTV